MKRITCILLLLLFLVCAFVLTGSAETVASGTCGDGMTWMLDDEGTLTIGGSGAIDDYRVRLWVSHGQEVYSPWYAYREEILSVVIDSGVTRIGNQAFTDCNSISEVFIADTVEEIGAGAFAYCSQLSEVLLPNSVTLIEKNAFQYCSALETVTLSTQLTEFGESVFSYCESLESVGEIPSGVTVLPLRLFENCSSLSDVTLPSSLVCSSLFRSCSTIFTYSRRLFSF